MASRTHVLHVSLSVCPEKIFSSGLWSECTSRLVLYK